MSKITVNADCGSAPKKLLRDLNIAFAHADVEAVLALMSDDICWNMVGNGVTVGKAAVREALEAMKDVVTRELIIHSIITQGREGAANGEMITEAGHSYAFCDVVQFTSAAGERIKSLTSYGIDITEEP